MITFYQGLEVQYGNYTGFVDFITEQYITICLQQFEHKSKDVCMLVYRDKWKDVQLLKQSGK
jgi:hypothetical protein